MASVKGVVVDATLAAPGCNVHCSTAVEGVAGPEDWCRACQAS